MPNDDLDAIEEKMDVFQKCRDGRLQHHNQCIHPTTQSSGHLHFLGSIVSHERECRRMHDGLFHDALEYVPYLDEDEDEGDVWYDA